MLQKMKALAKQLKQQLYVLYYAYKDVGTPWYAKLLAACVVAYAFSPIDLIPDFIPVLGYLDDIVLVPAGVWLTLQLIPDPILSKCRILAEARMNKGKQKNWLAGTVILIVWAAVLLWISQQIYRYMD
jgi:uncharacterized membrane protein YkvA (DUF1232 family)